MKKYLVSLAVLCAAGSVFAADYQIKSGGITSNQGAFNVWDGSAWVTATTAPGIDDSITSVTADATGKNLQFVDGATIGDANLNFESGVTALTFVPDASGAAMVTTIAGTLGIINNNDANAVLTIRNGGTWNAGTLSVQATSSGSTWLYLGTNTAFTVSGLSASGVVLNNYGTGAAGIGIQSMSDYNLGLVSLGGSSTSARQLIIGQGTLQSGSQTVTVAGLNSESYEAGRFVSSRLILQGNDRNTTLNINVAAGNTYTYAGTFESTAATSDLNIVKSGEGTQFIVGAGSGNVATGDATISAGSLFVQGSTTGMDLVTGNIVVENGARLGYAGTVSLASGNTLTVQSGGILQAGANDRRFSLTANNDIVMQDGSTLQFILGTGSDDAALGNSLIMEAGASLTADDITISLIVGSATQEATYTIVSGLTSDITENWTVETSDPSHWLADLVYDNGSVNVTMSYIPEPSACAALLGALGLVFAARRRR